MPRALVFPGAAGATGFHIDICGAVMLRTRVWTTGDATKRTEPCGARGSLRDACGLFLAVSRARALSRCVFLFVRETCVCVCVTVISVCGV